MESSSDHTNVAAKAFFATSAEAVCVAVVLYFLTQIELWEN